MDTASIINLLQKIIPSLLWNIALPVSVALLAVKFLAEKYSEKWIENKFQVSLETMRQQHAASMATLKVEIDALLASKLKVQEKEFDVLSTAWERLSDVMVLTDKVNSDMRQQSDMSHFTNADWQDLFERNNFVHAHRGEILNAALKHRNEVYWSIVALHDFTAGQEAISDLHIYLQKFGIFIPLEIVEEMKKLTFIAKRTLNLRRDERMNRYRLTLENTNSFSEEFMPRYDALHLTIRTRISKVGKIQ